MGKSEKQMDKEHERNQRIIDTALKENRSGQYG